MQQKCCATQACSAVSPSAEGWQHSGQPQRRKLPRMRLAPADLTAITAAAQAVLPAGSRVMLFGSRTDDSRRGGDIDLLVEPPSPLDAMAQIQLRSKLAARLYRLLGERRIDILVAAASEPSDKLVLAEARRQAIKLVTT